LPLADKSRLKAKSAARRKLDREAILGGAFAVLDEYGLDGLSLRVLASRLHVRAPALYWHVHNKAELIGMMAAKFGAAAAAAMPKNARWPDLLIAYAQALRTAMLAHRDSARLCAIAPPLEDPHENAKRIAEPLVAAGLDADRALRCQSSVIAYTLGWVIYEQSGPMHEHLAYMIDFAQSYNAGLLAMVSGFQLETSGRGKRRPEKAGVAGRRRSIRQYGVKKVGQ
jgi:TetR/AcrR family transcriptional regulator, tetracycline repressor protein